MTELKCFYDYDGELPNVFIAIYSDSSGCNIYYYSHDDEFGRKLYTSSSDSNDYYGVDEGWFVNAGYLWFVALPDDFKVWEED